MEVLNDIAKTESTAWADEVAEAGKAETPEPEVVKAKPEPDIRPEDVLLEPAIETKPEPLKTEPEKPKEAPPERMVPLQALHEERRRRAEIEQRAAQMEQYYAEQQRAMAPPPPDPNVDPVAALQYTQERLAAFEAGLAQQQQDYEQQQRESYEHQQALGTYASAAREFAARTPDFGDAYKHVIETRKGQLAAMGYDEGTILDTLQREELGLVNQARQNGRNPAELIYSFAKTYGYQAKAAAPPPAPAENIPLQQAKAAAATSISTGGKPPKAGMTMADVAGLNGAAFDSAWEKMAGQTKKNINSLFRN